MANYQSTHTGAQIDEGIDKANKALVKPDSAPSSASLVAVDNSNAQTMLAVGDGLSVENGTLKATSGGGTSIGGGFEIFSTWQGNASSSKFLILGKRAKDGVYGLHNKYDDLYNGKINPNSVAYTNVSIVIPLSWDKDYFYMRDYSALRAYDGTVLTATNKDNYINKICYLVKNADFKTFRCIG